MKEETRIGISQLVVNQMLSFAQCGAGPGGRQIEQLGDSSIERRFPLLSFEGLFCTAVFSRTPYLAIAFSHGQKFSNCYAWSSFMTQLVFNKY